MRTMVLIGNGPPLETRRHRLEKGGALVLGCLAARIDFGTQRGRLKKLAAPGRWCNLSQ